MNLAVSGKGLLLAILLLGTARAAEVSEPCPGPCVSFGPAPLLFRVDPWAADLALADFNGDGLLDVATANLFSETLSLLLASPRGGFEPFSRIEVPSNQTLPSSSDPGGIVAEDFDRDGKMDLAVIYRNLQFLTIYRGNGDGSFRPALNVPINKGLVSGQPRRSVQLGLLSRDFNGDGYPDIAVVSAENGEAFVSILLNSGTGEFGVQTDYRLPDTIAYAGGANGATLVAGDVNEDGKIDLVLTNELSAKLWVLTGLGDGTFRQPVTSIAYPFETPYPPRATGVALGDFDRDGHIDAAVTFASGGFVSVMLGDGRGGFIADSRRTPLTSAPGRGGGNHVAAADHNGDGRLDLIATNDTTIAILFGEGNGQFGPPQELPSGSGATALRVVDFNRDGYPDIIVSNPNESVGLYLQDQGGFGGPIRLPLSGMPFPGSLPPVVSADFNGNGLKDLASGDGTVWLQSPGGHFVKAGSFLPIGLVVDDMVVSLLAADFNRDGRTDVVFVGPVSSTVWLALGLGDGRFTAPKSFELSSFSSFPEPRLAAVDVDGDGILDLVVPNPGRNEILVLRGDGAGGFAPAISSPVGASLGQGFSPTAVAIADFDGDGKLDLAVAEKDFPLVTVLTASGDGRFRAPVQYDLGTGPFSHPLAIVAGDFDRDGHQDLAVAVANDFSVILKGKADGTFGGPDYYYAGRYASDVLAADFNEDGNLDLVFVSLTDLSVFMGDGRGSFDSGTGISVDYLAWRLALGDFNQDGRLDIAVSSCSGSSGLDSSCSISILRNTTFGPARSGVRSVRKRPDVHVVKPR